MITFQVPDETVLMHDADGLLARLGPVEIKNLYKLVVTRFHHLATEAQNEMYLEHKNKELANQAQMSPTNLFR